MTTNTNKDGQKIITIDASEVKNLGNPRWVYAQGNGKERAESSITETISSTPLFICLKVINAACDRYFLISDTGTLRADGSLIFTQDPIKPLAVSVTLTGLTLPRNEIISIDWISGDGTRMCEGTNETCTYTFSKYGVQKVVATVRLANKRSYPIEGSITINEPLIVARHAQIQDQDGKLLNTPDTYDTTVAAYVLRDISVPAKITLDARDVVSENLGYSIGDIIWKISDGKTITELVGEKVVFDIPRTERYMIEANYTFRKNIVTSDSDIRTARDLIILDLERKSLEPILNIQQSSDYTPAKVTVDASSSRSKNGTIQKFIFDFGEGKPQTE